MKSTICSVALAFVCSGHVFAQTKPSAVEVCDMAEEHYAAIRAGDMNTIVAQHLPEFTIFTSGGELLWTFESLNQQRSAFDAAPNSSSEKYIRHCSAQVYGDTGIATYYLTGTETSGGNTLSGTWRVTEVWVRQANEWKEAHHHESPLLESVGQ